MKSHIKIVSDQPTAASCKQICESSTFHTSGDCGAQGRPCACSGDQNEHGPMAKACDETIVFDGTMLFNFTSQAYDDPTGWGYTVGCGRVRASQAFAILAILSISATIGVTFLEHRIYSVAGCIISWFFAVLAFGTYLLVGPQLHSKQEKQNDIRHGAGHGRVSFWMAYSHVLCSVHLFHFQQHSKPNLGEK